MASDIIETEEHKMSQEPLLFSSRLPEKRKAVMSLNNISTGKNITKGCPQGSCCGPRLLNIQYDSLLNLQYKNYTLVVAFENDL